jgi:hypothetical protein
LVFGSVAINGGFQSGSDELGFTNSDQQRFGPDSGRPFLRHFVPFLPPGATATLPQWQEAFRAVTFRNSSGAPSTAARTISFVFNDWCPGQRRRMPASRSRSPR